jgi:hypothetical protein
MYRRTCELHRYVLHEVERRQTISKKDRIGIAVILDMDDEITAGTN